MTHSRRPIRKLSIANRSVMSKPTRSSLRWCVSVCRRLMHCLGDDQFHDDARTLCEIGSLAVGKRADSIAVPGNPLQDVTLMERVGFVMKEAR